jgi:hypothetical protein
MIFEIQQMKVIQNCVAHVAKVVTLRPLKK